jgi:4-alpha-glucanotransferase
LSREGRVEGLPVRSTKKLQFAPGDFQLEPVYELQNAGGKNLSFLFLVEWNLTLLAGDAHDRNYFVKGRELSQPRLFSLGEERDVEEMGMRDGWLGLEIHFKSGKAAKFWRYPVETISQSEGGFEKVYQGSCLLLGWEVSLKPGAMFQTDVTTELRGIS